MYSSCGNSAAVMELLDSKFLKVYHEVILEEVGRSSVRENKACLQRLRCHCGDNSVLRTVTSKTEFDDPAMRCAYIYQYGPCTSSAVACYFLKLLEHESALFQRIHYRDTFTVCCLGGGPIAEFVAIMKVLELKLWNARRNTKLKLNLIVVDEGSSWRDMDAKIVESLVKEADSSPVEVELSFLQADLTRSLTSAMKRTLQASDVVTMVNVWQNWLQRSDLQRIIECIGKDGTLFYLNISDCELNETLHDVINESFNLVQIYGPLKSNIHRMSVLCISKCLRLFSKYYGWKHCKLVTRSFVSVWYKL